jgi:hypothetical protein
MATEPESQNSTKAPLTPERADFIGHLVVNVPVVAIIGLGSLLGYILRGPVWAMVGFFLGLIAGWFWWSMSVPRWREWAKRQGADEERTQLLGEKSGLVWPKGSIFEKTESRPRKKT